MTLDPRIEKFSYAALRIVSGLAFSFHGLQKIFGVLTDHPPPAPFTQIWFGGLIELVCGVLIAIGLGVRPAAFLASGTMAVAYTQFHWQLQLGEKLLPAKNNGELALIYCFLFLFLFAYGPGALAVSSLVSRTRSSQPSPSP